MIIRGCMPPFISSVGACTSGSEWYGDMTTLRDPKAEAASPNAQGCMKLCITTIETGVARPKETKEKQVSKCAYLVKELQGLKEA